MLKQSITVLVKDIIKDYINEGSVCVDLTAGNGNDTLFMAERSGDLGRVYAFDIQKQAINNTKKLLDKHKLENRVTLIFDGHEKLDKYVEENIDIAMANFGYLPSGNKEIITKSRTSLSAVKSTVSKLSERGVLSLVLYTGHMGSQEERDTIMDYISKIDEKKFTVMNITYPNRTASPPEIVFVYKKSCNRG